VRDRRCVTRRRLRPPSHTGDQACTSTANARAVDFAALEQFAPRPESQRPSPLRPDAPPSRRARSHHIARSGAQYVGLPLFAPAITTRTERSWMDQFFVLKRYRRTGAGRALARHLLFSHPGLWEVGQMPGNVAATAFWRRVIGEVTGEHFVELKVS